MPLNANQLGRVPLTTIRPKYAHELSGSCHTRIAFIENNDARNFFQGNTAKSTEANLRVFGGVST